METTLYIGGMVLIGLMGQLLFLMLLVLLFLEVLYIADQTRGI
jgi:hypothetical protein